MHCIKTLVNACMHMSMHYMRSEVMIVVRLWNYLLFMCTFLSYKVTMLRPQHVVLERSLYLSGDCIQCIVHCSTILSNDSQGVNYDINSTITIPSIGCLL